MFLGEYEYKVDEKGRVPIPPRFKEELKDGVVLTRGPETCIVAYSVPAWNKLATSMTGTTMPASKARRLNRAMFAGAFRIPIDGQGRIALPVQLREYAGIGDELVIAGNNTYLELWDKQQWETEKAISQEQSWQIIESLERH